MATTSEKIVQCKVCGSSSIVKNGKIKGVQNWKCKVCGLQFVDNSAWYGMRTPTLQVNTAIQLYYQGISIPAICRQLQQDYKNYSSVSTVYGWIVKSSQRAIAVVKNHHPNVGTVWVANETPLIILGTQIWILDIMDVQTFFLLASQVSLTHDIEDVRSLIDHAIEKATTPPNVIITYGIGDDIKKLGYSFITEKATGEIEPIHKILQRRTNSLIDLKRIDKVIEYVERWPVYYNYYMPNENLCGKPAAELARVKYIRTNERKLRTN